MRKQRVVNRDVNAAQRASLALQLRAQRLTYQEIADKVGYASPGACRDAIMRELNRCVVHDAELLRREELDMLDRLHSMVWTVLMRDEENNDEDSEEETEPKKKKQKKVSLFAVDRVLSISEARRKLLGLDKKPDVDVSTQNYIKQIVLTHQQTPEDKPHAND